MGLLVKGQWQDKWYDTDGNKGEFVREGAQFRNWVTADGSAGPTGKAGFKAEAGRYHLYVSLACPWAHRTLIFRELKGLQNLISVSVVHPYMLEQGWSFATDFELDKKAESAFISTGDTLFNSDHMHQIYTRNDASYSGRVTVPVLWDKQQQCIVNNESSEIIRMFNSAFNDLTGNEDDYYPLVLREEIDAINQVVYDTVNNGVYRAGFATSQEAYGRAVNSLFATLDNIEERLSQQRYLVGERISEADWRLFTTLIRFDAVYVGHFKCNLKRIVDYPNIAAYTRELYQHPGVKQTLNMAHIKHHYYYSHDMINPSRVVPEGPLLDFDADYQRQLSPQLKAAQ